MEQIFQTGMVDSRLTYRAISEAKSDPRPGPFLLQDFLTARKMEDVATLEHDGGNGPQGLREANHAHVISILPEATGGRRRTSMQTGQTARFVENSATKVAAIKDFDAR